MSTREQSVIKNETKLLPRPIDSILGPQKDQLPPSTELVSVDGCNTKVIRCRLCNCRIISPGLGTLTENLDLRLPRTQLAPKNDDPNSAKPNSSRILFDHPRWWWHIKRTTDFDNLGVCRAESAKATFKYITCCDCEETPFGILCLTDNITKDNPNGEKDLYLCHTRVKYTSDEGPDISAKIPSGIDVNQLRKMFQQQQQQKQQQQKHQQLANRSIRQYEVTFRECRLGMQLESNEFSNGVYVTAFTAPPGPAELGGLVSVGDRVVSLDGVSVRHLCADSVLEIICKPNARPIRFTFETKRSISDGIDYGTERVTHYQWEKNSD